MKKQIFLIIPVLLLSILSSLSAQTRNATGTPHGIFVSLGEMIPLEGNYVIERSSGLKAPFEQIASVKISSDRNVISESMDSYSALFPDFQRDLQRSKDSIIQYVQHNDNTADCPYKVFPAAMLSMGVAYLDTQAEKGKKYQYRIAFVDKTGKSGTQTTGNEVEYGESPVLETLIFKNKEELSEKIICEWYFVSKSENIALSTVRVYRRIFAKGSFERINCPVGFRYGDGDTILVSITDTLVAINSMYEYKILPTDRFGNEGLTPAYAAAATLAPASNAQFTKLNAQSLNEGYALKLSWAFKAMPLVRSIDIYRSSDYMKGYILIAEVPPTDTSYLDHVEKAMENYYYYLVINGATGESYPSTRISGIYKGSDKPLPPKDFNGWPVKNGVKLQFGSEEANVTGFYVYRSDSYEGELHQISDFIESDSGFTVYTDTSKSLSGKLSYTYAVKAVNDCYQYSEFTEKIRIQPDIAQEISVPRNLYYSMNNTNVFLQWEDITQRTGQIVGYSIYRKEKDQQEYALTHRFRPGTDINHYTDTSAIPGKVYIYAVKAFDFSGKESVFSYPVTVDFKGILPEAPPAVEIRNMEKYLLISWGSVGNPNITEFRIYRYTKDSQPVMIGKVAADKLSFHDEKIKTNSINIYYVTCVDRFNRESNRSNEVVIVY